MERCSPPHWLVGKMLDLVKGETERIDARFLEPACGNFLVPILQRKGGADKILDYFGGSPCTHTKSDFRR